VDHGVAHSISSHLLVRVTGKTVAMGTGQSSFDRAAKGTLIPFRESQLPYLRSGRSRRANKETPAKAGSARHVRGSGAYRAPSQAAALLATTSWLVETSTVKFSTVGCPVISGLIMLTICS